MDLPLHQIEAITSFDGETFFVTNERFQFGPVAVPSKLHVLDLSDFTAGIQTSLGQHENEILRADFVYNKARRIIELKNIGGNVTIYDGSGKLVYHGNSPVIDTSGYKDGIYVIADPESRTTKKIAIY